MLNSGIVKSENEALRHVLRARVCERGRNARATSLLFSIRSVGSASFLSVLLWFDQTPPRPNGLSLCSPPLLCVQGYLLCPKRWEKLCATTSLTRAKRRKRVVSILRG